MLSGWPPCQELAPSYCQIVMNSWNVRLFNKVVDILYTVVVCYLLLFILLKYFFFLHNFFRHYLLPHTSVCIDRIYNFLKQT